MTTTPRIDTELISIRIAFTAAPSAPFLSPRPTHRAAAIAAASVTLTSSIARLRSGAAGSVASGEETVDSSDMRGSPFGRQMHGILRGTCPGLQIGPDQMGYGAHRGTCFGGHAEEGIVPSGQEGVISLVMSSYIDLPSGGVAAQADAPARATSDRGAATRGALLAAARDVFCEAGFAQAAVT